MPLTVAHPALIIPIRHRLVFSALVIGSMAPDFSKIVFLSHGTSLGHSVPGVFWFCVPVGLICFIAFQHFLKMPLFVLLPANHQARLVPWLNPLPLHTAARWGLVIVSLIIGAFTHLFWDSFTHAHGWFVQALPFLQRDLFTFRRHSVQIFEFLQYASAVGGLGFLAACYVRFYRKAFIQPLPSIRLIPAQVKLILACLFILTTPILSIILANAHRYRLISWSSWAARVAIAFMAVSCVELIFFSILWLFSSKNLCTPKAASR